VWTGLTQFFSMNGIIGSGGAKHIHHDPLNGKIDVGGEVRTALVEPLDRFSTKGLYEAGPGAGRLERHIDIR